MNRAQLEQNLKYLVDKYIYDDVLKKQIFSDIETNPHPIAKYVLSEIKNNGKPIESIDALMIKKIAFYYM
ncbi:hypothetical protein [Vibrio sp. LaRot3]|uniref:hypothetical protein n=1 Tax=Vibrio sp. LaRot3 TaxID=2998829 RepID=UPI0022CE0244|nr:hypothetical protein [Vibrio sp. LaRot3]MDA0150101.1 hypothetical protein [Vibrio sp. LaRot3]